MGVTQCTRIYTHTLRKCCFEFCSPFLVQAVFFLIFLVRAKPLKAGINPCNKGQPLVIRAQALELRVTLVTRENAKVALP